MARNERAPARARWDRLCTAGVRPDRRRPLPDLGADADSLFRLCRPGLEPDDGICRPIVAWSRALCRARCLCRGVALGRFRRRTVARRVCGGPGRGELRRVHRLAWLPFWRRGCVFRAAHDRLRRIHPDRLRSSRLRRRVRGSFHPIPGAATRRVVEPAGRSDPVLLHCPPARGVGRVAGRAADAITPRLLLGRRARGRGGGARTRYQRLPRQNDCGDHFLRHDRGRRRVLCLLLQQSVAGADLRYQPVHRDHPCTDRRWYRNRFWPGRGCVHPDAAGRESDHLDGETRRQRAGRQGSVLRRYSHADHFSQAQRGLAVARANSRGMGAPIMTALLSVETVSKRFRGLLAVDRVSFDVAAGEIFAVIGPNGAGKTTLFNMIAGVLAPGDGAITFCGERIEGLSPDAVCRRGIGRTFQIVRPFPGLPVEDNVLIGALLHRTDVNAARRHAHDVMHRLDLFDKRGQVASALTLPDRKRLEVPRALATEPKLLLLDEVMAGLRPTETDRMVAILADINRESGLTILLIEHVMRAVMALARRVLVLHHGAAIAQGSPEAIVRDPAVVHSYLGAEALS